MSAGNQTPHPTPHQKTGRPKIVFEDEWLLIVSKPQGLLVHGPNENDKRKPARPEPNLQDLLSEGRNRRLTLFHRLDRATSGIVILGKKPEIAPAMTKLFEQRKIRKAYYAIVGGHWRNELNRVESYLAKGENGRMVNVPREAGQHALTTFRVVEHASKELEASESSKTWIEAILKTGRTHQIRVHCASQGHPILGDLLYGGRSEVGLALHAYRVDFTHPITKQKLRIVDLPDRDKWADWLKGFTKMDDILSRVAAPSGRELQ